MSLFFYSWFGQIRIQTRFTLCIGLLFLLSLSVLPASFFPLVIYLWKKLGHLSCRNFACWIFLMAF